MRLQRVQIPNFRVLKDIDITFEEHYTPQIFPLASQNGGGKSTFLQVIFTLLNCFSDSSRYELLENLLHNSGANHFLSNSRLARIVLTDNSNNITLDFDFYNDEFLFESFLIELNDDKNAEQAEEVKKHGVQIIYDIIFSLENEVQEINQEIERAKSEKNTLNTILINYTGTDDLGFPEEEEERESLEDQLRSIEKDMSSLLACLRSVMISLQKSKDFLSALDNLLTAKGIKVISRHKEITLVCKINGDFENLNSIEATNKIFEQVFIAAPSNQVFLFLSPKEIYSLFNEENDYYTILKEKQKDICNIFLYEFSMIKVLTDAFKKSFENDRTVAIKNGGMYGKEFESLFNDLRHFLNGKTVQPSEDMSKIIIKQMDSNNQEIELSPTDLSHGELRRLSFYTWLKANKVKNSIVLVDEIEIGLHPDWQYQIVRDLEAWEPSNQYILATHSYEVCSALSPAHVKEIEPKLLKSAAKAT